MTRYDTDTEDVINPVDGYTVQNYGTRIDDEVWDKTSHWTVL